ncbi:MAG: T9SS type A sorting domain-containing protein [Candidatus Cloacimonadota bacterium]|nr:T9SS type A sorting domain-containing protein [Candidatus Cloacimonadota bacterium]
MKKILMFVSLLFITNLCFSEIIWEDGFETEIGWELSGEFEIGIPTGGGGDHGNSGPTSATEGENILGVDLSGTGSYPNDYETNLGDREVYAISPQIDCSMFVDINMVFDKYLNVEQPAYDHAYIDISIDGSNWVEIWTNDTEVTDNSWAEVSFDVSNFADGSSSFQVRFSIGETDGSWQYSGWNIDNFRLEGEIVSLGTVEGTIVDIETNEPIIDATIVSDYGVLYSDENGFFSLEIPVGESSISVYSENYFYANETFEIIADQTTVLEIPLTLAYIPTSFTAEITDVTNVSLNWIPPVEPLNPLVGFSIFRDNALLATVTENQYLDENLNVGTYSYSVQAIYMNSSSMHTDPIEIEILGYEINPPINLDYEIMEDNSVILSWVNPDLENVTAFNIYRDYEFIAVAQETTAQTNPLEEGSYLFAVTALYGSIESEAVDIEINIVDNNNDSEQFYSNKLFDSYPNPFNPKTTISFSVENDSDVKIIIYNIIGQQVKLLTNSSYEKGLHRLEWNGLNNDNQHVSSGVFFYRMMIDNQIFQTKKCIMIK